jgi:hypothetical protein
MHVRLLQTIAGHRNFWPAGTLYECPPQEAARLIAAGVGIEASAAAPMPPAVEAAAEQPPKTAALSRPKKRTRSKNPSG